MLEHSPPPIRVLFVCLGNICRSPMAEGAFHAIAQETELHCEVDSAGTASYHIGDAPDHRAVATAKSHGVDISHLRGRQLVPEDFYRFTHIFALDTANMAGVKAQEPRDGTAKLALLLDVVEGRAGEAVKDPYYGTESDFEAVWQEVSEASAALVRILRAEGAPAHR